MKKVEILTANTIPIQYETATLMNRGVALLLDLIAKLIYVLIITVVFGLLSASTGLYDENNLLSLFFQIVLVWLPITFYSLLSEYFFKGQTLGKLIMGIRVVNMSGENASFNDYVMRWTFRIVDFWFTAGGLGAILISTSENGQRLGGILSQTIVIRSRPTELYSIDDILKIKTKKEYTPIYLGVTKFTDDDMIILKNALSRYKKFPNQAHKEAVIALSNKIVSELKLPENPKKKIDFLKHILQDYIVLTR